MEVSRDNYLYEKSPKKYVELVEVVNECLEDSDTPTRGNRPLQACGTRIVAYKVAATTCMELTLLI